MKKWTDILLFVIGRVEKKSKQPMPQDVVTTSNTPGVLVGICNRTSQDEPQHPVRQLAPQVGEHLSAGVPLVMLLIEFFDGIR